MANFVGNLTIEPTPADLMVARRRVECSVCAFGGNLNHANDASRALAITTAGSKMTDDDKAPSATVTPSSSDGSSGTARIVSRARMKYEEALAGRYYENESRLSWEFEEFPPIEIEDNDNKHKNNDDDAHLKADRDHHDSQSEDENYCKAVNGGGATSNQDGSLDAPASPQPKMKYRCKLCGQPKQNHNCPYQQSLARSIGVNVYPTVNAFAADEPGIIAPPLTEMNNFFDLKDPSSTETSPERPTPDRSHLGTTTIDSAPPLNQVTPDVMRSNVRSVHGTPSTPSRTPRKRNTIPSSAHSSSKKRSFMQYYSGLDTQPSDMLFMDTMELVPEQYRPVTVSKIAKSSEAYKYPALPLPYAQRKRLSDNLFALSNEVPKLTVECAAVLREAREKDMWDLAVAELMTQVIVINHCSDGDHCFDGLRQYLLSLGIAC
jgi:hypothetical protein